MNYGRLFSGESHNSCAGLNANRPTTARAATFDFDFEKRLGRLKREGRVKAARRRTKGLSVFDEVRSEVEGFEFRQSAARARSGNELVFDVAF